MKIESYHIISKILDFKFDAGTSRGVLKKHRVYYLVLKANGKEGIGEIAPLPNLSIDFGADFESVIKGLNLVDYEFFNASYFDNILIEWNLQKYPSLVFALETAFRDLLFGGKKQIFDAEFLSDRKIPINGLIWMNTKEHMLGQIEAKLAEGYQCIKMKIGAINLEEELDVLKAIRAKYSADQLILRVDANGAFDYESAQSLLNQLEDLDIHSIEQPIAVGQLSEMRHLATLTKVGIALDEELIGIVDEEERQQLLEMLKPQYLILKPSLLGGFSSCLNWMELAHDLGIDYWVTSALESNIGLNAICQFADFYDLKGYQGLGTGQLYLNNIESPLSIENGNIFYDQNKSWGSVY